jgi:serine/threonine protein kinase
LVCLREDEVIAMVSGAMAGEALAQAEAHVDACRACRLLLSALAKRTGERVHHGTLSAFVPGDVIAERYRVVRLIGAGGMGEVYETLDLDLGGRVALKTIAVGADLDAASIARLKAEVEVARRVTHRNVCRVFDVGYHSESVAGQPGGGTLAIPFFTMELLPGETLGQLLKRRGPCSAEEALQLITQIGTGLDALHRSGVIHGDLKSDNIMLVPEASATRAVIMDFGLAMRLDGRTRPMERGSAIAGTIGYMAPEQFGNAKISRRTDIYAFGIILHEVLTGHLPFTPQALAASALEGAPPNPRVSSIEGPSVWVAIIDRCTAPSPSARFGSAEEVLLALGSAMPPRPHPRWSRSAIVASIVVALLASVASLLVALLNRPATNVEVSSRPTRADAPALVSSLDAASAPSADAATIAPSPDVRKAARVDAGAAGRMPSRSQRSKRPAGKAIDRPATTTSTTSPSSPGEDEMIDPRGWR